MQTQPYPEGEQDATQRPPTKAPSSLLIADCGAVMTKLSLFGLVEGQYRLMARSEAPTTLKPPAQDITEGIIQALQVIEFITGRRFLEKKRILSPEQPDGNGVDLFIATISAGDPLRLLLMGSVNPALEGLVKQAVASLYTQVQTNPSPAFQAATTPANVGVGAGSMSGIAGSWTPERTAQEWERQLTLLRDFQPHATLVVGAADGPAGPTPLQEACQLLVNAARSSQPTGSISSEKRYTVMYAGAPQYVDAVRRLIQGIAEIIRLEPLTSPAQMGPISQAAGSLHERLIVQKIAGYDQLNSWSNTAPVASAISLSSLVRFLAQHYAMNVVAVDAGGATTSVMVAGEQGEFIPQVNTSLGIGSNVGSILQQVGWQQIARWLPFSITENELRQFVINRMSQPHAVPTEARELQILQAFAREALRVTTEAVRTQLPQWPDSDMILATGGILAHAPKHGQAALMLLDALQPRGVTSLILDRSMLLSQLGAVAAVAPIMAVQVNENDAVSHRLGRCVVPYGNVQAGQLAVRVGLEYSNGRQTTIDVMGGTIEVIPMHPNEQAHLTLFPAPTVDVGLGPGERARAAEEIDGGLVGLIVDARGRPLVLPDSETERQARLLQWAQAIGA